RAALVGGLNLSQDTADVVLPRQLELLEKLGNADAAEEDPKVAKAAAKADDSDLAAYKKRSEVRFSPQKAVAPESEAVVVAEEPKSTSVTSATIKVDSTTAAPTTTETTVSLEEATSSAGPPLAEEKCNSQVLLRLMLE
ncbi:hypothetical protein AAVH_36147, partial [Aphelenchoides avenae]